MIHYLIFTPKLNDSTNKSMCKTHHYWYLQVAPQDEYIYFAPTDYIIVVPVLMQQQFWVKQLIECQFDELGNEEKLVQ